MVVEVFGKYKIVFKEGKMTIENIQTKVIDTYNNNMKYLEKEHKSKYEKLKLFETALELGEISERYALEFKEDYFDIYDKKEKKFVYDKDSIQYTKEVVSKINFMSKTNSFKTFYGIEYEDEIAEKSKKLSMLANTAFGNAPIIDYVNRNLPESEEMKEIFIYLIFGLGLGLHLPLIHRKVNARLYLITEPSLEIFRLSLFVTDYSEIAKKTSIIFSISENEDQFRKRFQNLNIKSSAYNHYIKFFMFSPSFEKYITSIQHTLVSQGHLLYAYNRELLSLNRTYQYSKENFNFINIYKPQNLTSLKNKKVLILAAGPSLNKNLNFIKNNQNKYIIVAVYSLIPYLEKHNIRPDIITQYDEEKQIIVSIFQDIKNRDFFKNTLFLFSSHICKELINFFQKDNIFIFQALHEVKRNFGYLTSPSIGEITYALVQILGAKDISLLGIDMALDPETGKSHHSDYNFDISKNINKNSKLENFEMRKNKLTVKGNFIKQIETLSVYKASIEHINLFTKRYKEYSETKIYNLSNGAYFEDTIPTKADDIDTSNLENLDKEALKNELINSFNSISSNEFTKEDLEYNKEKLKDSIKLKEKLDSFYLGKKYSNAANLRQALHEIQEELLSSNYQCKDLQKIIINYTEHNLHYVFYFTNLKNIDNPKKHIKQLFKILNMQINRIIKEYQSFIKIT